MPLKNIQVTTIAVVRRDEYATLNEKVIFDEMLNNVIIPIGMTTDRKHQLMQEVIEDCPYPEKVPLIAGVAIGIYYTQKFEA